jgi:pyruvate dehydrogenase E2 component (dihydrolipoamide acetyltransferase)
LGEGAESGTVVSILVKEGDLVSKGQTILELENEKAVAPIPSPVAGRVSRIRVKEGDKLSVGQGILSVEEGRAARTSTMTTPLTSPVAVVEDSGGEKQIEVEGGMAEEGAAAGGPAGTAPPASPSIRRMARELGIDLSRIRGSERGGRIVLSDVRAYIAHLQQRAAQPNSTRGAIAAAPPVEPVDFSQWGAITKKPMSSLRKTIARRMAENWNAIPHVTQFDEADITGLMELRKKYAPAYEAKGARLTLTSFALKAVVSALKKHPIFNASLDAVAGEIVFKQYYHIGLAVDTDQGLIVPVIRDVDKKSLWQLSKDVSDMADKARERKVSLDDLKGGTFTISNQGGIGGGHFTPIVNKPEVAILGLGRGAMKAVVKDGRIEPCLMLPLAISYDHRVIDGGAAARFTVDLVKELQEFKEEAVKL